MLHVNTEMLNKRIAMSGKTKETVAKEIGIDYSTFARKMNCKALAFSVGQMHRMTEVLNLSTTEACEIFFAN